MKSFKKSWILLTLSCITIALAGQSKAQVLITFGEVETAGGNTDVVLTWSGSINLGHSYYSFPVNANLALIDKDHNYVYDDGATVQGWLGGSASDTSLIKISQVTASSSAAGAAAFGFSDSGFFYSGSDITNSSSGSLIDFDASNYTITFKDVSLLDVGATQFDNTLAWTSAVGGTNTISYTTKTMSPIAVPEPSSFIMIGLAAFRFILRRKR